MHENRTIVKSIVACNSVLVFWHSNSCSAFLSNLRSLTLTIFNQYVAKQCDPVRHIADLFTALPVETNVSAKNSTRLFADAFVWEKSMFFLCYFFASFISYAYFDVTGRDDVSNGEGEVGELPLRNILIMYVVYSRTNIEKNKNTRQLHSWTCEFYNYVFDIRASG